MTTRKPFVPTIAPEVMAAYAEQSARFNVALAEQLTIRTDRVSMPAGSRGDFAHDVPVLAENADGSAVTAHDYGTGLELQCTCQAFDIGRPCAHVAAVEAKIAAPELLHA